jgi:DNA polymerase V
VLEVLGPIDAFAPPGGVLTPVAAAVSAGFPSPAQDHYLDGPIDLNENLILDRTSTFILNVAGDSMIGAGIFDGDQILVDRSIEPDIGDVVVAIVDGELTLKRLARSSGGLILRAENPMFRSIPLEGDTEMVVWGVVTFNIHRHR